MARRIRSRSRRSASIRRPGRSASRRPQSHRRGSTLLIVMVLMGMLALLGVMFYTFAAQERSSAESYSEAAKVDVYGLDVDAQMDFALEQLIVGANPKYKNSALWGGRHALLPNMLGYDIHPFNGQGVDTTNPGAYANFNDSPAARGGIEINYLASNYPAPDVDYTYPDINNVFLSYDGNEPQTGKRIIIPSFHRPQVLRPNFTSGPQLTIGDVYNDSTYVARLMRPHRLHEYVAKAGQQLSGSVRRYLDDGEAATLLGPTYRGFPLIPPDLNGNMSVDQGVWQPNGGPPSASPDFRYEFDVDNDGDGVREGVWLDLDFPPQEAADGTLYVPMISFTVKDADGLINLNAHGNLARVWNNQVTLSSPFLNNNNDPFVSKSNLGLSASEINPAWGMNRLPASEGGYANDTFFGGSTPTDWREIANRELAFLKLGRVTTSPSIDLTPGVFGEENLLLNAVSLATGQPNTVGSYGFAYDASVNPLASPWPGPGQTKIDDNGNLVGVWGGNTKGVAQPAFVHPLDFLGIGTRANTAVSPKSALLVNSGFGAVWPQYNGYSRSGSGSGSVPVGYFTTAGAGAMTNSSFDALFNDMQEIVFDLAERRDADNLFGPDEMRALHLSTIDYSNAVGGETRLTTLAPYTFAPSTTSYGTRSSQKFREKFTTESWDRKNFSWVYDPNRPWEFNANLDQDFIDLDGDGTPETAKGEFPPFVAAATPYSQNDPFRPVLRTLLETERFDWSTNRRQLRFSVNELLTDSNGNPVPAFAVPTPPASPPSLQLSTRPLTPHPDPASLGAAAIIPPSGGLRSYPANGNFNGNIQLQEYWARVDRQLMARDIYVMLYMLGSPESVGDPTQSNATNSIYSPQQLSRMAQFAVNLVDALDRDNILTRFEYDPDLSDGWGVDDNPYSGDSLPSGNRPEVWGTERLDVTLSETLAVLTDTELSDFSFTQWKDDGPQATYFTYVELRNPGPFPVDFSNSAWQLEIVPNSGMMVTANDPLAKRLTLLDGNIPAGQTFTIGSASTSVGGMYPSIMKVNPDPTTIMTSTPADFDSNTATWIAPPLGRQLDLDLQDGTLASWYQLRNGDGGNPGVNALLESTTPNILESQQLEVNLRRRAYPNRPIPSNPTEEADNPWVSVDTLQIDSVPKLKFSSGDTAAQIQAKLGADKMKSRERREPFAGYNGEVNYNASGPSANMGMGAGYLLNTLEGKNSQVDGNFSRWQHHFDRDFASMAEILQLPIRGGVNTVRAVGNGFSTPVNQNQSTTSIGSAASQFLMPTDSTGSAIVNRWHRVLELLEVPTRAHVSIPGFRNPLDYPRVPGKINLNTIRHAETLAAIIDDPSIISLDLSTPSLPAVTEQLPAPSLYDRGNYWANLLQSRDGRRNNGAVSVADPATTLFLPGTATSTPYRSPSYSEVASGSVGLNTTTLRPWNGDLSSSGQDPRQFFELGTRDDHIAANSYPPSAPADEIEPALRDRITGKMLNNTTTRSNVFVVFVSIKYFRAVDNNGAIRIGQALATLPGNVPDPDPEHRGFFVIDRSQPERSYDSSTGRFNFKDFILFRQILQ